MSTHDRNTSNRKGVTYRFQAISKDGPIDEVFSSCAAIVKKYGKEFSFNRDQLYRLRKKKYGTSLCCHAQERFKNIYVTDIYPNAIPDDCAKLIDRKNAIDEINAILQKSDHVEDILHLIRHLEMKK